MATNADFTNLGALPFMQSYPLIPEGGDTTVASAHGAYNKVPKAQRVMYMDIQPGSHYSLHGLPLLAPTGGIPNREGDPQKAICYAANNAGGTRLPVFWLPYHQNSVYRMTLAPGPVALPVGVAGPALLAPQPNFFLTDAVDGCSVYVEGTRVKPTVHHVNAAGTKFTPLDGSAPFGTTGDFRKDTLAFHTKDAHMTQEVNNTRKPQDVLNAVGGLQPAKYVKNDDYMIRDPRLLKQEARLIDTNARSVVTNQRVDRVEAMTQGTVFGTRNAANGEWTFYFQRRLVVILYHNKNKWKPFVKTDEQVIGYRMYPVLVQEFWPGGQGHLFVRP
ncbi:hypothetical protein [uncultured Paludibaculum sp.]|uniref:hypothetical protein n=1 Tax=uncultured Paludibaculum sp. TaxID=1765020 RepID=UPI002AAC14D2|nr:hypothetical protein [uncultured Paludibaculum sp.]